MGWLWDTPTEEQLLRRSNFPGKKLGWEIQEKTYTEVPSVSVENNALQLWKCNNFDGVLTCQKNRCWTVQEVGKSEGSNGDLSTEKKKKKKHWGYAQMIVLDGNTQELTTSPKSMIKWVCPKIKNAPIYRDVQGRVWKHIFRTIQGVLNIRGMSIIPYFPICSHLPKKKT